jgi:hypothetical protein
MTVRMSVLQSCTVSLTAEHGLCNLTAVHSADLPSACSESGLTATAGGSEGSNVRVEGVLPVQQQEDHSAPALPAVKAVDKVCYVCNIMVLTVVQVCKWSLHSGSELCGV